MVALSEDELDDDGIEVAPDVDELGVVPVDAGLRVAPDDALAFVLDEDGLVALLAELGLLVALGVALDAAELGFAVAAGGAAPDDDELPVPADDVGFVVALVVAVLDFAAAVGVVLDDAPGFAVALGVVVLDETSPRDKLYAPADGLGFAALGVSALDDGFAAVLGVVALDDALGFALALDAGPVAPPADVAPDFDDAAPELDDDELDALGFAGVV